MRFPQTTWLAGRCLIRLSTFVDFVNFVLWVIFLSDLVSPLKKRKEKQKAKRKRKSSRYLGWANTIYCNHAQPQKLKCPISSMRKLWHTGVDCAQSPRPECDSHWRDSHRMPLFLCRRFLMVRPILLIVWSSHPKVSRQRHIGISDGHMRWS